MFQRFMEKENILDILATDSQAKKPNHLKIHDKSKHGNISFKRKQCKYQTTLSGQLKKHQEDKHKSPTYN